MKLKFVLRITMVILALIAVAIWWLGRRAHHIHSDHGHGPVHGAGAPVDYGEVAPFSLTTGEGKALSNDDLKGKVWVANFIFTRCQGPCPVLTSKMSRFAQDFADEKDLRFVSFSVDPDYDRPPVLADYMKTYGADASRWHFLTGARDEIYGLIRESFHLAVEPDQHAEHADNQILHSLHFVLVDRDGRIVGYYHSGDPEALANLKGDLQKRLSA